MKQLDPDTLAQFTGTAHYYRISPQCLLTDGTRYLADAAGAFWLMDAAYSHLVALGTQDGFVLVRLVVSGTRATLTLEDGNGHVRARQLIPYTDFPADEQRMFACWDGQHWVLMLPSEY